jgi:translation initiation factor 1
MPRKAIMVSTSDDSDRVEEPAFGDILRDLDRDQVRIIVRLELRRFRKPTTLITGLPPSENEKVARDLKKRLATGGSSKDGQIILQGDHREAAKDVLVKTGYSPSNIEVQ